MTLAMITIKELGLDFEVMAEVMWADLSPVRMEFFGAAKFFAHGNNNAEVVGEITWDADMHTAEENAAIEAYIGENWQEVAGVLCQEFEVESRAYMADY